ncbi:MAG: hypothetical protein KME11_05200 [Timaviella obliquedivisa GSE-PSE-MK23-08B]|jgi:hypothetical protein|nr:hypothetical protein [Timaviella obliquedivisa GSE-PSE-MK23-08B]
MEQGNSPTLKKLRSPPHAYRIPKTHASWELISAIAAICTDNEPVKNIHLDPAANLHRLAWKWWVQDELPTYCISHSLLKDFQETDINGLTKLIDEFWTAPLPGMLLLLPNSALCTSEGNPIPYLLVVISDGINKTPFRVEHKRQISIFLSDQSESTWMTGFGLGDNEILFKPNPKIGTEATTKEDELFLAKLRTIVLQIVLSLSYLPELIDSEILVASDERKGFGKQKSDRPLYRVPRWIGKDYQRQSLPRINPPQGTHASPHAHWRRGHWRQQSHGVGMKERKLIWIKPIWISG